MSSKYPSCSVGLVLPLTNERGWTVGVRATLYFIAMLYFFLGGAVVMDYVMASTSIITSNTKKIYLSKVNPGIQTCKLRISSGLDVIEVRVWHDTIINLSLMAFSTSAYEILLCTIEIIGENFDHGELGPGTIVGSAVFNILVTTSLCIVFVPQNEIRKIEKLQVYCVSMVFAIASYAWMVVILYYFTPEIITLWESIVTVSMFPIFIVLVWLAHHNILGPCARRVFHLKYPKMERLRSVDENTDLNRRFLEGEIDREKLAGLVHKLKRHSGLTDRDAATIAGFKLLHDQPHSALWYRLGAIRSLTAGYRYMAGLEPRLQDNYRYICDDDGYECDEAFRLTMESAGRSTLGSFKRLSNYRPSAGSSTFSTALHHPRHSIVEFHSAIIAVDRNVGSSEVIISRYGNLNIRAKVRLTSTDGTARKNRDYKPLDQILVFEPGQHDVHVLVVLLNAEGWEEDKEFFLRLSLIHNEHENIELGRIYLMAVTMIDGKKQSIITFEHRGLIVKESAEMAILMVNRHDGAAGVVSIHWKTVDKTAVSGRDFLGGSGELVFNSGEMSLNLEIPIINHMADEKDMYFVVELFAPSGGARLGIINRCAVTIIHDDDLQSFMSTMASVTTTNMDAIRVTKSGWLQQIMDALLVDGGKIVQAKRIDYLAHFFSFLWKALFSLIPPPTLWGGWPCYLVSLIALGCMALLMADSAKTFGCLIGMDTTVTAISFVAIGASLPEVLCARRQMQMERTADICMVGMAGKISANLMLGLGVPWLIAVVYHQVKGTSFIIRDDDVGRNVIIFIVFALVAQSVLIIRRISPFSGKAEFGGPRSWGWMTSGFFLLLWVGYLTFAHYLMHGHITPIE